MKNLICILLWILFAVLDLCGQAFTFRDPAAIRHQAAGGGAPAGNSFTAITNGSDPSTTGTVPASQAGDLVVLCAKWEAAGSLTQLNVSSGETVTMGDQGNNGGSDGEPHVRMGWYVRTGATGSSVTWTAGTTTFQATWWYVFRPAGGTVAEDVESSTGQAASGATATSGTFTTATQNGVTVAVVAGYEGGLTYSAQAVGGSAAAGAILEDNCNAFYYLNTAQLSSATAVATRSSSAERWTIKTISFKAE